MIGLFLTLIITLTQESCCRSFLIYTRSLCMRNRSLFDIFTHAGELRTTAVTADAVVSLGVEVSKVSFLWNWTCQLTIATVCSLTIHWSSVCRLTSVCSLIHSSSIYHLYVAWRLTRHLSRLMQTIHSSSTLRAKPIWLVFWNFSGGGSSWGSHVPIPSM